MILQSYNKVISADTKKVVTGEYSFGDVFYNDRSQRMMTLKKKLAKKVDSGSTRLPF
jgi:hypothetical protein